MTHYTIRIVVEEVDPSKSTCVPAKEVWRSPAFGDMNDISEAVFLAGKASAEIIHDLRIKGIFECEP